MDGKDPIQDMAVKGLFNENTTALVDPEDITLKELDQTDRAKLVRQLEQESLIQKQNQIREQQTAEVSTPAKQPAKKPHDSSSNLEQLLEAVDATGSYEKQVHASPAPNFDTELQSASSSKLKLEEVQSSASKTAQPSD